MRTLVKNMLAFIGNIYYFLIGFFRKNQPWVKVLIYHDIPPEFEVNFKNQIRVLGKRYDFITPLQFHNYIDGEFSLNRNSLVITFDDGFESSYTSTVRILEPLGIKALFFICSGFIDSGNTKAWRSYTKKIIFDDQVTEESIMDWHKPMSWNQVAELNVNGHMIGGHTKNHSRLSKIKEFHIINSEISDDKSKLESVLGEKINAIAYPYGDINSISTKALNIINSTYEYCYSGIRGNNHVNEHKTTIKRDAVGFNLKTADIKFIANGGYNWYYKRDRVRLENMVSR